MSKLQLVTRQVGPWGMNTYALICPETKESILFDPGADPETLVEMLSGSQPIAICLTHTHIDHIGALDDMMVRLQVPLLANDGPHEPNGHHTAASRWLRDGDTVKVGNSSLNVIYAPGHIGDQICFAIAEDHRVIVGDTIFEGGPGRTWSSEGFQTTLKTLKNIVLTWPDETVCYPGHGPAFRLGDQRKNIEAFLEKDHGDFHGDATWDM